MIEIEKGVPLPNQRTRRKYPLQEMEVGDSIFAPERDANTMRSLVHSATKRIEPKRSFVYREENGGTRIWRTK